MQENLAQFYDRFADLFGGYLPNLLGALAILLVGWIVALVAAALVRGALRRTDLDNRVAAWALGREDEKLEVERWIGKAVYYLILLFVLVAFFQALQLTLITEPLNALLTRLSEFAPRLLGAAGLLAVAWILASLVRRIVTAVLDAANLDRRLAYQPEAPEEEAEEVPEAREIPLTRTIGESLYWLIFLLFLPAVLDALQVEGLMRPVQGLIDEILGYLPNIFAAVLILAVGWFVARLVQRIVANLLAAAGTDRLSESVGISGVLGRRRLSGLIGLAVYVLILIPVLIASLNALELEAVTAPASDMLGQILDAIPDLFAAALLLGLSYVVGRLVADLVANVLAGAGFDNVFEALGLAETLEAGAEEPEGGGARRPSAMVGTILLVVIMLFASIEAAGLIGFETLAELLSDLLVFGGEIVLGVIVFGVGLYLANLAHETIAAGTSPNAPLVATGARIAILVLAGAMALRQMGLASDIINLAFGLLLGAIAVAIALAFGLGSRELAGRQMQKWVSSLEGREGSGD